MKLLTSLLFAGALATSAAAQNLVANLVTNAGGQPSSGDAPFYVIGTRAVFVADGAFGLEPYVTDGTVAGTRLLLDLAPAADSAPQDLCVLGNEVLFSADVPGLGRELWKTDGTTAGTVLVKDVRPGPSNSNPSGLIAYGGYVWFSAFEDGSGF